MWRVGITRSAMYEVPVTRPSESRIGIDAVGDVGSSCRAAVDVADRYQHGSRCGGSVSTRSAMYEVAVARPSESRIGIDAVGDVGSSCRATRPSVSEVAAALQSMSRIGIAATVDVAGRYRRGFRCRNSIRRQLLMLWVECWATGDAED